MEEYNIFEEAQRSGEMRSPKGETSENLSENLENLEDIIDLLPSGVQEALEEGERDVWRRVYIKPRKSLGQHLLKDPSYLRRIVEHASITSEDVVVEFGSGTGTLTRFILEASPKRLYAIEKDYRFCMNLIERLGKYPNLKVVHGDIREVNLKEIAREEGSKSLKVLGNIPFNITGLILRKLVENLEVVSLSAMTFQREVVVKLTATTDMKEYSFLSVGIRTFFNVEPKEVIPPWIFIPPPKVFSQIALLTRRDENLWTPKYREEYFSFVRDLFTFGRKRKFLKALRSKGYLSRWRLAEEEALELLTSSLDLDEKTLKEIRVFQIPPEIYAEIFKVLRIKRS